MVDYHDQCYREYMDCLVMEDYEAIDIAYGKKVAATHILEFFYEYAPEGER